MEDPSGDYVSIMAICQASKLLNPGGGSTQNTLAVAPEGAFKINGNEIEAILGDYVDPEETIEVFLSFPADQLGGGVEQLSNVEGNILVANEINGKQKGSYPIKVD